MSKLTFSMKPSELIFYWAPKNGANMWKPWMDIVRVALIVFVGARTAVLERVRTSVEALDGHCTCSIDCICLCAHSCP